MKADLIHTTGWHNLNSAYHLSSWEYYWECSPLDAPEWIGAGASFGEQLSKYISDVVVDREGDEDDGNSICCAPVGMDGHFDDDMTFIAAANPATILEILDRLEAAEKSDAESIAMYRRARDERDELRTELAQLHKEADKFDDGIDWIQRALQAEAKIEAMEKQKPVGHVWRCDNGHIHGSCEKTLPMGTKLYALPGAQGE